MRAYAPPWLALVIVLILAGVGAYYALLPQDTIETEQASEVDEQASEEEEGGEEESTEGEESTEEEEEVSGVESVTVVYTEPAPEVPAPQTPVPAVAPAGITAEQQENRHIYEERMVTYDGTGPSPWVQGQIDWAREQGLMPSEANPTSLCHQDRSACTAPNGGLPRTEQEMEQLWEASGRP
jgi:hypothetical protein